MKRRLDLGRFAHAALALAAAFAIAGCGGGGGADLVLVADGVSVPRLDLVVSRPGPQAIQLDWSDDPIVATFRVTRNGQVLADVTSTTSLIDASVLFNAQYCYQVFGYDPSAQLVSATDPACVTI